MDVEVSLECNFDLENKVEKDYEAEDSRPCMKARPLNAFCSRLLFSILVSTFSIVFLPSPEQLRSSRLDEGRGGFRSKSY